MIFRQSHFYSLIKFNCLTAIVCLGMLNVSISQVNDLANRFRLAQSFENAGEFEKAEVIYKDLLVIQPWNNQYLRSLNDVYLKQKDYSSSISLLEKQLKKFPNDLNIYGMLGTTYYLTENEKKAFEIWDSAVNLNPSSIVNYKIISNYALENRAFDKAIEILREGKKVSKDPTQFSFDLANLFAVTMKYGEAAGEYCDILSLKPLQLNLIKHQMTQYLGNHGAVEESIEAVTTFFENSNSNVFLDLLGFLYVQKADFEKAFDIIKDLDNKIKNNGVTLYNFAQDVYLEGEFKIASQVFQLIIERYPESQYIPAAKMGYVRSLESTADKNFNTKNISWKPYYLKDTLGVGKYGKIISEYERIADESPNSNIKCEAIYREALILKDKFAHYSAAKNLFDQIISNFSQSTFTLLAMEQLALSSIIKGNLDSAEIYSGNIITSKLASQDIISRSELLHAKILFWKGDFSEALNELSEISKNSADEQANDAMEISLLLTTARNDSLNLVKFSEAEFLKEQYNFSGAAELYKTVFGNTKILPLGDFAKFRYAEMLIALDDFSVAVEILSELSNSSLIGVYTDKSLFLLGRLYQYGIKDLEKAKRTYSNLLENFPGSLYYDEARKILNDISNKTS